MPLLGVNIDHAATLRQQRKGFEPDPVRAALLCQSAGADSIVAHLREDRRHIQDKDIFFLRKELNIRFNLEMSIAPEIVDLACKVKPDQVTIVPERRRELTTEGGLDVLRNKNKLIAVCARLAESGILVSLFIDPEADQVAASKDIGVEVIELHTGAYAEAQTVRERKFELKKLTAAAISANALGMTVNAGHGLKYDNTVPVANIEGMHELNIGHSIISYAVFVGLERAVREMKALAATV